MRGRAATTALIMALMLILAGWLVSALSAQQVASARGGFAACHDLTVWRAQEAHRLRNPQGWYPVIRRMMDQGQCWLTRQGEPLYVRETRHPRAVVVQRPGVKGDRVWWIAREAFRWN